MSGVAIAFSFAAYCLVGAIVIESCRIWRAWWLRIQIDTVLLWPLFLLGCIFGKDDQ